MKNRLLILAVSLSAACAIGLADGSPFQIKWRGSGGWGDKSAYCMLFDTKAIETDTGEVVSLDPVVPMQGMSEGVQIHLKTAKEVLSVHLGPKWFIENQDIDIEAHDTLTVKGSRVSCGNQIVLVASEVRKGTDVIKLRDDNGRPAWTSEVHTK